MELAPITGNTLSNILLLSALCSFWAALSFMAYSRYKLRRDWKSLPTLDAYLAENPQCRTDNGLHCSYCNSTSIRNWGLFRASDDRRVFICNHCGSKLYRSA